MEIKAGFGHHCAPTTIALGRGRGQQHSVVGGPSGGDQYIQLLPCHALRHRAFELNAVGVGGLRQAETVITGHTAKSTNPIHFNTAARNCPCSKRITNSIGNTGATALQLEHQAAQATDLAHHDVVSSRNTIDGIHGLHIAQQADGSTRCREAKVGGIDVAHRL